MATKKSSMTAAGVLVFLGSLVYLFVWYSWYTSGAALPGWLSTGMATFWIPIFTGLSIISAITLFFMGIGGMAMGGYADKMKQDILWKFIIIAGLTLLVLTGGSGSYWWALVGFILTYLGASWGSMKM